MPKFSQIIFPLTAAPDSRDVRFAAPYVAQVWALLTNLDSHIMEIMTTTGNKQGGIKYIVDVGACVGGTAIPYAVTFLDAKILAIEPSRHNYGFLQFNCKDFASVELLKMAVHNKNGFIQIAAPSTEQRPSRTDCHINTGLISAHGGSEHFREDVAADTLDNIVDRKVDWLKIDVEGHEQAVLEGATRILSEDKPVLQVEMSDENQAMGPYTLSSLLTLIGTAGYVSVGRMRADIVFMAKERLNGG